MLRILDEFGSGRRRGRRRVTRRGRRRGFRHPERRRESCAVRWSRRKALHQSLISIVCDYYRAVKQNGGSDVAQQTESITLTQHYENETERGNDKGQCEHALLSRLESISSENSMSTRQGSRYMWLRLTMTAPRLLRRQEPCFDVSADKNARSQCRNVNARLATRRKVNATVWNCRRGEGCKLFATPSSREVRWKCEKCKETNSSDCNLFATVRSSTVRESASAVTRFSGNRCKIEEKRSAIRVDFLADVRSCRADSDVRGRFLLSFAGRPWMQWERSLGEEI